MVDFYLYQEQADGSWDEVLATRQIALPQAHALSLRFQNVARRTGKHYRILMEPSGAPSE